MRAIYLFITTLTFSCHAQTNQNTPGTASSESKQEEIMEEHLKNGAWKHALYSREWQEEIDKGLAKDSTIAYLWQQKAMPLFKQGKYELGMTYIDKAVQYDPQRWQSYRAFIKCIFAKTYGEAIADFNDCKRKYGNRYVMDHTYDFFIALSLLQLNEFERAENIFHSDIESVLQKNGEEWVHHLSLFYYGICQYEQRRYREAIIVFDRALKYYPQFSDALYYKSICLDRLGEKEEAKTLMAEAQAYAAEGYTINDDSIIYERYPYQVRWPR